MTLIVASTAGDKKQLSALQNLFAFATVEERERLIAEEDLPLVYVIQETTILDPEKPLQKKAFPVLLQEGAESENWPHTVFSVRAAAYQHKRYAFAFSRIGADVIEIDGIDDAEQLAVRHMRQFPFERRQRKKSTRGEIEIQERGGDLEVCVATYYDLANEPAIQTSARDNRQYVNGQLFRAQLGWDDNRTLEQTATQTHGVIAATRNVSGRDERMFIGNTNLGSRTFVEQRSGASIRTESSALQETVIGFDRYVAAAIGGSYFGYTDNRAFFHLHLRNEQGTPRYPYLGKTPAYGTLDLRLASTRLPLPATSLIFVEGYKEKDESGRSTGQAKDYVILGLQNSQGRLLVFEIDPELKEQRTIEKIKRDGEGTIVLAPPYLTKRSMFYTPNDAHEGMEDRSVRNLKTLPIGDRQYVYYSVGKKIVAVELDDILKNRAERVMTIAELKHDIVSMDIMRT